MDFSAIGKTQQTIPEKPGPPSPLPDSGFVRQFLEATEGLKPPEKAEERQRFFNHYFQPSWHLLDQSDREVISNVFGKRAPFGGQPEETLRSWQPPSAAERIFEPGNYSNPVTTNVLAHLGNVMNAVGTPGRALREGIYGLQGMAGRPRPYKDPQEAMPWEPGGLAFMKPENAGEWAEAIAGPKAASMAWRFLKAPLAGVRKVRQWNTDLNANIGQAKAESPEAFVPPGRGLFGSGTPPPAPTGPMPWPTMQAPPAVGAPPVQALPDAGRLRVRYGPEGFQVLP